MLRCALASRAVQWVLCCVLCKVAVLGNGILRMASVLTEMVQPTMLSHTMAIFSA